MSWSAALTLRGGCRAGHPDATEDRRGAGGHRGQDGGGGTDTIIDDLGMRKLPQTAAEDLLELIMRRYERASTLITSNRPVEDWGKVLGDAAAVGAMLDRLLHHAHVLKCGPRSWRTKLQSDLHSQEAAG